MQSKLQSLLEAFVGIAIGFLIAVLTGIYVYPLFHYSVPLKENCEITSFFTLVSIIRQYYVRRLFNLIHGKQNANRTFSRDSSVNLGSSTMGLQQPRLRSDTGDVESLTEGKHLGI